MPKDISQKHKITLRAARVHLVLVLALAISIIVYDSSKLITPEAVLNRWKYCLILFITTIAVWSLARLRKPDSLYQKSLIGALVLMDIIIASLIVYADRGMSSVAVLLYAVPITTSALTYNRIVVVAAAAFSTSAYAYSTIKYFVDFFNEGYKVQLYSTIGLYGAVFFILAMLLVIIIQEKPHK